MEILSGTHSFCAIILRLIFAISILLHQLSHVVVSATFARDSALAVVAQSYFQVALLDAANQFVYWGQGSSPAQVCKINIASGSFSKVGSCLVMVTGENIFTSGVIDTTNNFAYYGTDTSSAYVCKINTDPSSFAKLV
jgi:hypothetical protein